MAQLRTEACGFHNQPCKHCLSQHFRFVPPRSHERRWRGPKTSDRIESHFFLWNQKSEKLIRCRWSVFCAGWKSCDKPVIFTFLMHSVMRTFTSFYKNEFFFLMQNSKIRSQASKHTKKSFQIDERLGKSKKGSRWIHFRNSRKTSDIKRTCRRKGGCGS